MHARRKGGNGRVACGEERRRRRKARVLSTPGIVALQRPMHEDSYWYLACYQKKAEMNGGKAKSRKRNRRGGNFISTKQKQNLSSVLRAMTHSFFQSLMPPPPPPSQLLSE